MIAYTAGSKLQRTEQNVQTDPATPIVMQPGIKQVEQSHQAMVQSLPRSSACPTEHATSTQKPQAASNIRNCRNEVTTTGTRSVQAAHDMDCLTGRLPDTEHLYSSVSTLAASKTDQGISPSRPASLPGATDANVAIKAAVVVHPLTVTSGQCTQTNPAPAVQPGLPVNVTTVSQQAAIDDASELELDADNTSSDLTNGDKQALTSDTVKDAKAAGVLSSSATIPPLPSLKRNCCDDVSELQCFSPSPIKRLKASEHHATCLSQEPLLAATQELLKSPATRQTTTAAFSCMPAIDPTRHTKDIAVTAEVMPSARPQCIATTQVRPAAVPFVYTTAAQSTNLVTNAKPLHHAPVTTALAPITLTASAPGVAASAVSINLLDCSVTESVQHTSALHGSHCDKQATAITYAQPPVAKSYVHVEELPTNTTPVSKSAEDEHPVQEVVNFDTDVEEHAAGQEAVSTKLLQAKEVMQPHHSTTSLPGGGGASIRF